MPQINTNKPLICLGHKRFILLIILVRYIYLNWIVVDRSLKISLRKFLLQRIYIIENIKQKLDFSVATINLESPAIMSWIPDPLGC